MIENMILVCQNVLLLMWMIGVGMVLARKGWLSENTQNEMSKLMLTVVMPCQIITSMPKERSAEVLEKFAAAGLALLAAYLFAIVVGHFFFRKQKEDTRVVLQYALIYGNHGFMGLPLVQSVFGEEAVIYAAISIVLFNIFSWTHGIALMGKTGKKLSKKAIINPGTVGFSIGLFLFLSGLTLPMSVGGAVKSLGSMFTPLAMVLVGAQMSRVDPLTVLKDWRLYVVSLMKLLVLPGILMLALYPFRPDPILYTSVVVLFACPTAALVSTFVQMYQRDTEMAAKTVLQSTLLSVVTLPLMVMLTQLLISLG